MLTIENAERGKSYRIRAFRNMLFSESKKLRKRGIVEGVGIILVDKTSYDFYLLNIRLHNGDDIRWAVNNIIAGQINIEVDNDSGESNV